MSKLDRFLLSPEWIFEIQNLRQWALSKSCSDHFPIMLGEETKDWGPTPIKFFEKVFLIKEYIV